MTREAFLAQYGTWYPGAMYGDAHPSGAHVRLYFGSHLETHLERVEFPPGAGAGVLFPMLTVVGGFRFAGQLHGTPNTNAEWSAVSGKWKALPTTFEGHTPCIYDLDGWLWQNGLNEFVGSPGYRQIGERDAANPGGRRIAADDTTLLLEAELSAYSAIGPDLVIGQGHPDAAKDHCWIWHKPTKTHRLLIDAPCWFIRAKVEGDTVALYIPVRDQGAWIVICPIAALLDLPVSWMPGFPLPAPIGPTTPPRAPDGRLYDLLPFIIGDASCWPRSGPTHPMHQVLGPPPGIVHFVKFGTDLPAPYVPGEAYEMWAWDEHWIYHLEDAAAPPYSFSDPRWFQRRMAIGEAHAFEAPPHEAVFRERGTCAVIRSEPFGRRMWVQAVYDGFYWGPDLGNRPTLVIAYDPTAGIHGPTRHIELGYYAHGAGSVRWESYPSDQLYPPGATEAQFDAVTPEMVSDFYLLGGPALQPKLTGCVPQIVPSYPPLPDPGPDPEPEPPPAPFQLACPYEVPMTPIRVALRLGQYFASVDPADVYTDGILKGWPRVRFLPGKQTAFTLSQPRQGDVRLRATPENVPAGALSIDATEFSGNLAEQFAIKPNVPDSEWGGYEALNGWTLQGQGIDLVLVQYDRDGQKYASACLTVVPL